MDKVQLTITTAGAIPEISLRVGVNPVVVSPQVVFLTNFLTKCPEASSNNFICWIMYKTSLKSLYSVGMDTQNNNFSVKKLFLVSAKGGLATTATYS